MSRSGNEMMLELASLLGTLEKTAAKKDDSECDKDEAKMDESKEEGAAKCEKKVMKKKVKKKKKKADVMMDVVSSLVKLAGELDEAGADEASSLVDDALRVIVKNIEAEKTAIAALDLDDESDVFESDESVTGTEEGMGSRMQSTHVLDDDALFGDVMDKIDADPTFKLKLKELLSR